MRENGTRETQSTLVLSVKDRQDRKHFIYRREKTSNFSNLTLSIDALQTTLFYQPGYIMQADAISKVVIKVGRAATSEENQKYKCCSFHGLLTNSFIAESERLAPRNLKFRPGYPAIKKPVPNQPIQEFLLRLSSSNWLRLFVCSFGSF